MAVASGVTYLNPIRRERRGRAFLGSRLCKRSASETLIDPGHPPWSSATAYTYTLDCRSLGLMKNTFGVTALLAWLGSRRCYLQSSWARRLLYRRRAGWPGKLAKRARPATSARQARPARSARGSKPARPARSLFWSHLSVERHFHQ